MSFDVKKRPIIPKCKGHNYNSAVVVDPSQDFSRTTQIDRELLSSIQPVEEIHVFKTPRPQYKVNLDNELVKDPRSLHKKKILLGADYIKEINERNYVDEELPGGLINTNDILKAFMKENQDQLDDNVRDMHKTVIKSKLLAKSQLEVQRKATMDTSDLQRKLAPYHYPAEITYNEIYPALFGQASVSTTDADDLSSLDYSDSVESSTFDDFYFDAATSRFINRKHPPVKQRDIAKRLSDDLNGLDRSLHVKFQKIVKSHIGRGRKDVRGMNHMELMQLITARKASPKVQHVSMDGDSITETSIPKKGDDKMSKKLDRAALFDDWEIHLQKRSLKFESSIRDAESAHMYHGHGAICDQSDSNHIVTSNSAASVTSSIKTVSALSSSSGTVPTSPKPSHSSTTPLQKRVKYKTKTEDSVQSVVSNSSSRSSSNDIITMRNPDTIEDEVLPTVDEEEEKEEEQTKHEKVFTPTAPPTAYFVSSIGAVSCRKNIDPSAYDHSIPYFTSEARAAKKRSEIAQARTDRGFTSAVPKQVVIEMFDKVEGEEFHKLTKNSERYHPLAVRAITMRKAIEEDVQTFNEIVVKMSRRSVVNSRHLVDACSTQIERKEESMRECIVMMEEEVLRQASRRDEQISSLVVETSYAESTVEGSVTNSVFLTQPN